MKIILCNGQFPVIIYQWFEETSNSNIQNPENDKISLDGHKNVHQYHVC